MSDEVSQFLEQVERLRGQQVEEDSVRAREREEYLAAKRERQARREERARSISPQKSSPANTPSPRSNRRSVLSDAPKLESPAQVQPDDGSADAQSPAAESGRSADATMNVASSPTKENESPLDMDTKSAGTGSPQARGSPLSWQQRRPTSRGGSRPLSMLATQNATQRSLAGSQESSATSATEQTFTKDQIAHALGSKDPSFFRQTPDRGANSAAYRKNQVEDENRLDMSSVRAQLPGLGGDSRRGSPSAEAAAISPTRAQIASLPQLNPSRFDGPYDDKPAVDRSPSGRTSPQRSNSPTKGMGGFVQSAMMKRSDSVKRWSVTSPPGLARADSVTSSRSGNLSLGRQQSVVRPGATTPSSSRPASRHGESEADADATPKAPSNDLSIDTDAREADGSERGHIPTSPSKTMDPRRWSPTKSSWLESALNKPETPRPNKPQNSSQPAWMAELNKNKRPASVSHRHQVSIGGLMRSSPMGSDAKPNATGLGGIYSPPPGGNRPAYGHGSHLSISKSASKLEPTKTGGDKSGDVSGHTLEGDAQPEPSAKSGSESPDLAVKPQEPEPKQEKERLTSPTDPIASPVTKPKPETPPKDFRGSLRHRPTPADGPRSQEPEFKNVFGNLRRTKTQNYVAPDELKNNILRGKAALSVTDGPQKSERVDEFKDAILKKKDDFKKVQSEGRGVTRSSTIPTDGAVPEGLAKRAEMTKKLDSAKLDKPESPKPIPGPKRMPSQPSFSQPSETKTASESKPVPALQKETSAPSRLQGRVGGGKLADRFNQGLAGMLARGPPPMATNGGKGGGEADSESSSAKAVVTEPTAPGPQLTHMTKGRARGPRRKAPTAAAAPAAASTATAPKRAVEPTSESAKQPEPVNRFVQEEREEVKTPVRRAEPSSPLPSIQQQVAARAAIRAQPASPKPASPKPQAKVEKPSVLEKQQPKASNSNKPDVASYPSPLKIQKTGDAGSQPGSPRKLEMNRISKFADDTPSSPAPEPARLTHQRTGSRSPNKMFQRPLPEPTSPTKVDSDPVVSVRNATALFGGSSARSPQLSSKSSFDGRASELEVAKTPNRTTRPLPAPPSKEAKPQPASPQPTSPPSVASPKPSHGNDVATLLSDIFGPKQSRPPYKVDAAEVLANRPTTSGKVQSLSFQVFKISGDGKKVPVSSANERVLFEQEMYICPHSFTNEAGWKRLEIYFWVGEDVSRSEAEDALVFVNKEAKVLNGKIVKIMQGKETAEFLQAMGGVAIIRRGSSTKFDSLAPSMLCGRRFLGQVVFDQVDLATLNLCAGFPYLVTHSGNCFLWKGKGSDVAELSCARLIGMELSLTGELIEYDEGREPASFWDVFEGGSKPHSADHWRLKPNYSKYCSRLFCSDAGTKQQISEVAPFNQRDLLPEHIYVLDAFFEMYVIVGAAAHDQYASFRNALDFAQEYAILASGMEDRPFVPISTVVLEGIPRDLKRVFRCWRDELSPTAGSAPVPAALGAPKRGRSLRVVSLTQALQALSE